MTKYDTFLNTPMQDNRAFSLALMSAVREIRAEELGVDSTDLAMEGDPEALKEINQSSLRPIQSVFNDEVPDIASHAKNLTQQWDKTLTLWRGTRLPDNASSFQMDGIHVTPQLDIANGYASGGANSNTGVGRLLKHNEIGFVTSYEAPLDTKTYKNFQYEDAKKDKALDSNTTLRDLKSALKELTELKDFSINENGQPSLDLKVWQNIASNNKHYEVVLKPDTQVSKTYLRHKSGMIKVNMDNPKWDQLLARVQEASLRDFYEIKPLEDVKNHIQNAKSYSVSEMDEKTIKRAQTLVNQELDMRLNAPWEAQSMKDITLSGSEYIKNRPYILESICVGSSMDTSKIARSEKIEKIMALGDSLASGNFNQAEQLMDMMENKKTIRANIGAMRSAMLNNNTKNKSLTI